MKPFNEFVAGDCIAERYEIEAPLGRGRSSMVYRAFDRNARSAVAIKVLDPFLARDTINIERFKREAIVLRRLNHPNIVKVFELLQVKSTFLIVMENFEGTTLKAHLQGCGTMSLSDFLPLALSATDAVQACHRAGVLHRDLKPQNILINPRGEIKIIDFGISKTNALPDLTKTGTILGTPEYMAPEMFQTPHVDCRADIYGLGIVFYEAICGRPPHRGSSLPQILSSQMANAIMPISDHRSDLPSWVGSVISKCLRSSPEERYQSCFELMADLEKEQNAQAVFEESREKVSCLNCKTPLIAGLPFCFNCGHFPDAIYSSGKHSIALYRCESPRELGAFLSRILNVNVEVSGLDKLPRILMEGLSKPAAEALYNEMSVFPCELALLDRLPTQFQLPWSYSAFALLPLLVTAFISNEVPLALAVTGGAMGIIWALYKGKTRTIVGRRKLKKRARKLDIEKMTVTLSRKIMEVEEKGVKFILGNIARTFLALLNGVGSERSITSSLPSLSAALDNAVRMGRLLAEYAGYLSSRSLNEIRSEIEEAGLKIRSHSSVEKMESLIERKARLEQEFAGYLELQERYSQTYTSLLNFNALLKKMERDVAGRTDFEQGALRELSAFVEIGLEKSGNYAGGGDKRIAADGIKSPPPALRTSSSRR